MEPKKGRPMVYAPFIIRLDNTKLYAPQTILEEALEEGLFHEGLLEDGMQLAQKRAYDALCRYRTRKIHVLPDGLIPVVNGREIHGWYGWRWRMVLPKEFGIVIDEAKMPGSLKAKRRSLPRYLKSFRNRLTRSWKSFKGV